MVKIRHSLLFKRLTCTTRVSSNINHGDHEGPSNSSFRQHWTPLTTHSRNELDRKSPLQRYQQLVPMLQYYGITVSSEMKSTSDQEMEIENLMRQKEKLIKVLRENTVCRRLASLAMKPDTQQKQKEKQDANIDEDSNYDQSNVKVGIISRSLWDHDNGSGLHLRPLTHVLSRIWPELLELPPHRDVFQNSPRSNSSSSDPVLISVVIPSYAERSELLEKQMRTMMQRCIDPASIEIIIVDAGGRSDKDKDKLQHALKQFQLGSFETHNETDIPSTSTFGHVALLEYTLGGGRGPCLNYGANAARGEIITFCHLDTTLPWQWDKKILKELKNNAESTSSRGNSCAFNFGIDTSPQGLSNSFTSSCKTYYPPGIKAVETTANIRTRIYSLPYGDQAISVPKLIFEFVGGFPDQCLMEDYELVALLRKRATLLDGGLGEALKIIPGDAALCSPRRWQKFGVLFVTFMNSKFVNLYSGGLGPDQLYELYYGSAPPKRESELSPWEIDMEKILESWTGFSEGKKHI